MRGRVGVTSSSPGVGLYQDRPMAATLPTQHTFGSSNTNNSNNKALMHLCDLVPASLDPKSAFVHEHPRSSNEANTHLASDCRQLTYRSCRVIHSEPWPNMASSTYLEITGLMFHAQADNDTITRPPMTRAIPYIDTLAKNS